MKFIYAALFTLAFSSCATREVKTWIAKPTEKQYSGRAILVGPNVSQEDVQRELTFWVGLQGSSPNLITQDLKRCIVADESLKTAPAPSPTATTAPAPTTSTLAIAPTPTPEPSPVAITAAPTSECTPTPQKCVFVVDEKRSSVFSRTEPQRAQICVETLKDSQHVLVDLYWPTQPVYWTTYAFQSLKTEFEKKFGADKVEFAQITRVQ